MRSSAMVSSSAWRPVCRHRTAAFLPDPGMMNGERPPGPAAPPRWISSGRERLRREIPQPTVEPDVLPDGGDAPGPSQPAARRPTAQAADKQVLLDAVENAPEVDSGVLDPPAGQKL